MLQLTKFITISVSLAVLSACALSPGMRVGDIPASGARVVTESGLSIQVEALTAHNLPAVKESHALLGALPLFAPKSYPVYLLASGDVLGITLWANPEITPLTSSGAASGYVVDQSGYISFPLIGEIKAQGESVKSFTAKLKARLAVYLKYPDAQVKVLSYNGRKFVIDGEVKAPGQYALSDQSPFLDTALSSAGGATATADINNITLTRNGKNYHISLLDMRLYYPSDRLLLREGDSIHVYAKENSKIYVLGEVGLPSALRIPEQGFSLMGVIGEGRGLNSFSANPAKVYVVRDDEQEGVVMIYHLDLSSIANVTLAERFKMKPNDVVYVDASGLARWNRVLSLLLPSANAFQAAKIVGSTVD